MGGAVQEEWESSGGQLPCPLGPREPAELPGRSPALQSPLQVTWVLAGHRKEAKGRTGEAGRRGALGGAGEERRAIAPPTHAQGAC